MPTNVPQNLHLKHIWPSLPIKPSIIFTAKCKPFINANYNFTLIWKLSCYYPSSFPPDTITYDCICLPSSLNFYGETCIFSSPDPKCHVRSCHHFVSVFVCKLFTVPSTFLKPVVPLKVLLKQEYSLGDTLHNLSYWCPSQIQHGC